MMETAMSIRQQQQMLSERENRQEHAARELGTLNKLEKNPYSRGLTSVKVTKNVMKPSILGWLRLPTSLTTT